MLGVVSEYLKQLVAKQIEDYGLVVLYDPEKTYDSVVKELSWPNTTLACYDGSFIKLRKEIDPLLNDSQPPRLVIYVPVEREQTNAAMIELDNAGVVMQPRQQPLACNTRLSVVARNALKSILGDDQVGEIEKQVEAGKLTLADLDSLAEQGLDISTGVVKLIFGTANPQDVALMFLHSDSLDQEIKKKEASKELRQLLQVAFEIELSPDSSMAEWRVKLGRHALVTDLMACMTNVSTSAMESVSMALRKGSSLPCNPHLATPLEVESR